MLLARARVAGTIHGVGCDLDAWSRRRPAVLCRHRTDRHGGGRSDRCAACRAQPFDGGGPANVAAFFAETIVGAPIAGTALNGPRTLAIDADGNLIIVLREGNAVFRANLKTNTLQHLTGTGKPGFSGDGADARLAQLAGPKGAAFDRDGNLLLVDTENHAIRIIDKNGRIDTLVGDGKAGDGPDGDPRKCRLNRPHGVFVDANGVIYIGDSSNNKVRKLIK